MLEVFRDSGFEVRSKSATRLRRGAAVAHAIGRRRGRGRDAPPPGDGGLAAADARAAGGRGHRRLARSRRASAGGFSTRSSRPASAARSIRSTRPPPRSPACARIASVRDAPGRRRSGGHRGAARRACSPSVDDCAAAGVKSLVVDHGRLRRGRRRRARAAAASWSSGSAATGCGWSAPTAWGCSTPNPAVRLNASFSPIFPPPGHVALLVAERRPRARDSRAGRRPRRRPLDLRQRRQQGRRVGQRSAGVLGRGPGDPRHPALSRVVRQPAAVRAPGAPRSAAPSRSSP